jgi:hypothetical protein
MRGALKLQEMDIATMPLTFNFWVNWLEHANHFKPMQRGVVVGAQTRGALKL